MLIIKKLTLQREEKLIIKNFSAKFSQSEIILVTGKNSSGKTSLLKTLANLLMPNKGSIELDDIPIQNILQPYCLYISNKNPIRMDFSVLENVKFWSSIYKNSNINQTITYFQLESILKEQCRNLSSGIVRKISLVRVMLSNLPMYLLDEVETHLDIENKLLLQKLILLKSTSGAITFIASNLPPYVKYHRKLEIIDHKIINKDLKNSFLT